MLILITPSRGFDPLFGVLFCCFGFVVGHTQVPQGPAETVTVRKPRKDRGRGNIRKASLSREIVRYDIGRYEVAECQVRIQKQSGFILRANFVRCHAESF